MTTPAAAAQYLQGHLDSLADKGFAVINPHSKPLVELPVIYGFNNGGPSEWLSAVLIAEDGEFLGSHCCSHEGYMPHDLGILEGTRPDRHEEFAKKYPDGYRMEFVGYDDLDSHADFQKALKNANERAAAEKDVAQEAM